MLICFYALTFCSYNERAMTEKILQKLELENYQVSSLKAATWNLIFSNNCSWGCLTNHGDDLLFGFFRPHMQWYPTFYFPWGLTSSYSLKLFPQLGKTKVFLRAGQIGVLDSQRAGVLDSAAKRIQLRLRTFIAHKDFTLKRAAAISFQAYCRGSFLHMFSCFLSYPIFYNVNLVAF